MQPQYKLHLIGPIATVADGYAFHARELLRTLSILSSSKIDLKATSAEPNNANTVFTTDQDILNLLTRSKDKPEGDIIFNFLIPPAYRHIPGKKHIGFCTWETTLLPPEWPAILNNQDAIVVPSYGVKEILEKSGVNKPLYVIGCPVRAATGKVSVYNNKPGITFMTSGNWIFRKNIETLIFAFCQAFDGIDNVRLLIKTWASNNDHGARSHIEGAVRHLKDKMTMVNKPQISVVTDIVQDDVVRNIINGCDIYVSTSRGEGLDLGCLNALANNKYVVSDSFIGHKDLLGPGLLEYDHTLVPVVDSGVPFHNSKMRWAQPNFESLVSKLVEAYDLVVQKTTVSNNLDRYSPAHIASQIENLLADITNGKPK